MSPRAAVILLLLAAVVGCLVPRWTGGCSKGPSDAERMTLGERRQAELNRRIDSMMPLDRGLAAEANEYLATAALYRQQLRDELQRYASGKAAKDAEIVELTERLRTVGTDLAKVQVERRQMADRASGISADITDLRAAYEKLAKNGVRARTGAEDLSESLSLARELSRALAKKGPLTLRVHLTHHAATHEAGAYTLVRLDEDKASFRLGSVPTGTRNSAKARRLATEAALAAIAKAVNAKLKAHGAPAAQATGEILAGTPKRGSALHAHVMAVLDLLTSAGLADVVFDGEGR